MPCKPRVLWGTFVIAALANTGCLRISVGTDWPSQCQLHERAVRNWLVSVEYGLPVPLHLYSGYKNTRADQFPYARNHPNDGCLVGPLKMICPPRALVRSCADCDESEAAWLNGREPNLDSREAGVDAQD